MEFKGVRMTNAAVGAVFGPEGKEFPWRAPEERLARETGYVNVLDAVKAELRRQDAKWGEQNHPDGTGPTSQPLEPFTVEASNAGVLANMAQEACDLAHKDGADTWALILLEEVFEALAEDDPDALEAELIQVAAVAVQWALAVRRRHV